MKLFLTPGACSLSPHIALREAGLPFEFEKVDLRTKKTESGGDYWSVNGKGAVPALQLDNGQVLTEGAAIVQYIADRKPELKLAPAAGTLERYRLQEWLNYVASELHKSFAPLFNPATPEEQKNAAKDLIGSRLDFVSKSLEGKPFLLGDSFTVADGYLFTVLSWTGHAGIDLAKWPALKAYCERISSRPAVAATLKAEGLIQ
jgi:glutathione S-transferase